MLTHMHSCCCSAWLKVIGEGGEADRSRPEKGMFGGCYKTQSGTTSEKSHRENVQTWTEEETGENSLHKKYNIKSEASQHQSYCTGLQMWTVWLLTWSFLDLEDEAIWARYWMTFFVFSVFPAPDSPLYRRKWNNSVISTLYRNNSML